MCRRPAWTAVSRALIQGTDGPRRQLTPPRSTTSSRRRSPQYGLGTRVRGAGESARELAERELELVRRGTGRLHDTSGSGSTASACNSCSPDISPLSRASTEELDRRLPPAW